MYIPVRCLCLLCLLFSQPLFSHVALEHHHEDLRNHVKHLIAHDEDHIVIQNVRVIDGTGAATKEGLNIHISNGTIVAIDKAPAKESESVIDAEGKTIMPGLIMFHEHLFWPNPTVTGLANFSSEALSMMPLYLAAGVTTMRTAGSVDGIHELQVHKLVQDGRWVGPDLYVTAPYVGTNTPEGHPYHIVDIEEESEARRYVRHWVKEGISSFKVYQNVKGAVVKALIDEAHMHGAKVTGHLCSITFEEAIEMGIDNLEHGLLVARDFVQDKEPDICPRGDLVSRLEFMDPERAEVKRLIELLVAHDVAVTSTLPVFTAGHRDFIPTPESLDLLSPRSKSAALQAWNRILRNKGSERQKQFQEVLRMEMAFEKAFVDAGGTLLIGTDPPGWGGTLPPNANHAALMLLVEAGFTPIEAIVLSTSNGARYLGIEEEVGTVEVGKRADLVLVDGKPDLEIKDIQNVSLVFRNGVGYRAQTLLDHVRGTVGR